MRLHTIVALTDFSPATEHALERAALLASASGLLGGRLWLDVRPGWCEPAVLWMLLCPLERFLHHHLL